jgi:polyketide biosynthesis acyl carrier protein
MDREQIMNAVIKNIKLNIDGLEDTEIDPEKSMAAYGAESLDIVEITSASMRELQIKVPRTELANLKNINNLVDIFYKYKM